MKNILIMCVIIAVTTISCKKENEELIVGKWKITSIETFEEDNTTLIEVNNNKTINTLKSLFIITPLC